MRLLQAKTHLEGPAAAQALRLTLSAARGKESLRSVRLVLRSAQT